jgi:hypothetical protein
VKTDPRGSRGPSSGGPRGVVGGHGSRVRCSWPRWCAVPPTCASVEHARAVPPVRSVALAPLRPLGADEHRSSKVKASTFWTPAGAAASRRFSRIGRSGSQTKGVRFDGGSDRRTRVSVLSLDFCSRTVSPPLLETSYRNDATDRLAHDAQTETPGRWRFYRESPQVLSDDVRWPLVSSGVARALTGGPLPPPARARPAKVSESLVRSDRGDHSHISPNVRMSA